MRAADADIDDVGNLLIVSNLIGQSEHLIKSAMHFMQSGMYFSGPSLNRWRIRDFVPVRRCSQQPVHDAALFRRVDGIACQHGIALGHKLAFLRQLQQQSLCVCIEQIFGQICEYMGCLQAE